MPPIDVPTRATRRDPALAEPGQGAGDVLDLEQAERRRSVVALAVPAEVEPEHAGRPAQERPVLDEVRRDRSGVAVEQQDRLVRVAAASPSPSGFARQPAAGQPQAVAGPQPDDLAAERVEGRTEAAPRRARSAARPASAARHVARAARRATTRDRGRGRRPRGRSRRRPHRRGPDGRRRLDGLERRSRLHVSRSVGDGRDLGRRRRTGPSSLSVSRTVTAPTGGIGDEDDAEVDRTDLGRVVVEQGERLEGSARSRRRAPRATRDAGRPTRSASPGFEVTADADRPAVVQPGIATGPRPAHQEVARRRRAGRGTG